MKGSLRLRIKEVLELLSGSVLPIIFWMSLIFGFDPPYIAILTIISALIHELGHILAIRFFTDKNCAIKGHASGFRITKGIPLSYKAEILILLAGPLSNILLFILLLPLGGRLHGYLRVFALITLATGLSNLLPVEGYDGYGALCELFKSIGHPHLIQRLEMLSFVLGTGITFLSLYMIDRFGEGYWLFGLFFFNTLSKIVNFGKYDIFEE